MLEGQENSDLAMPLTITAKISFYKLNFKKFQYMLYIFLATLSPTLPKISMDKRGQRDV